MTDRQALLFLPVIHAGYEAFLTGPAAGAQVLLLGRSFAARYKEVAKEIRALDPHRARDYLVATGTADVVVVEEEDLPGAVRPGGELVVADEAILRDLVARYGLDARTTVRWERTFLRWDADWARAGRPAGFDHQVTGDEHARRLQALAGAAAARSSDWWRQVGAVAAREGSVIAVAHNVHQPSEYTPYLNGDPRNAFSRGVEPGLGTAQHAEAALVAGAARDGICLAGADLHVTTFPCPTCARLVATAGFARCFFAGPYSMLDGVEVLQAAGVELIFVEPA